MQKARRDLQAAFDLSTTEDGSHRDEEMKRYICRAVPRNFPKYTA
jgi:hypothetical protein